MAQREAELSALRQTRTFRYTGRLRQAYGRARRGRPAGGSAVAGRRRLRARTNSPQGGRTPEWIEQYDRVDDDLRGDILQLLDGLGTAPLVSIIMPVYNPPEAYLRAAIESVLNQLYPQVELCIADDSSTEEWVPRVLAEYAGDRRVRVVRREVNGHISRATNSALAVAQGSWVGFLDHDDQLSELAVALTVLAVAAVPGAGLSYSDEDKISPDGARWVPISSQILIPCYSWARTISPTFP